jgi:hypothetical protein
MHEILIGLVAVVMFLSPCVIASLGNTERRIRRSADKPYNGVERRDLR